MSRLKNYYEILGIAPTADSDMVRTAYRKLARQFHPDVNPSAEDRFKDINEAYETLRDVAKRARYDSALGGMQARSSPGKPSGSGKQQGQGSPRAKAPESKPADKAGDARKAQESASASGTPINDLFESFLKKGFQGNRDAQGAKDEDEGVFRKRTASDAGAGDGREKARRGEDVVVKATVSPMEAEDGVVKTVNVQHNEICRKCAGTGKLNGSTCATCKGEKVVVRLRKIDVRIPAGVKTGSKVRVAKEGGRGQGGAENGDLFLQIEIVYDASLRIEGLDVFGEMPIAVTTAVLGGEVEVSTLHGSATMTVPAGTSSGKRFRLKEHGVKSGQLKGDHYVTVHIEAPESLTARERELYEELARLRPDKPSGQK